MDLKNWSDKKNVLSFVILQDLGKVITVLYTCLLDEQEQAQSHKGINLESVLLLFHNAKNLGYQGKRGLQGGYGNFVPSQFNLIKNFDPDL